MLKKVGVLYTLALLLGACVPEATDKVEFGENSPMAAIQAEGTLIVALPVDAAPFSYSNASGEPKGMLIELGTHFADALGVDPEFVLVGSEHMARMVAGDDPDRRIIGDEDAHVAFPLYPVDEALYKQRSREMGFDVTTPYFLGHQRLLVPQESSIENSEGLGGMKVCALIDPLTGIPLEKLQPEAEVTTAGTHVECSTALLEGKVDAAVASETDLLIMLAQIEAEESASSFRLTGEQATTQGYAPLVVKGMSAYASDIFIDMREDGRWVEAYNKWIAPLTGEEVSEPPGITLEEAAALYPMVSDEATP